MSRKNRAVVKLATLGFLTVLTIAMIAGAGEAAVGNLLRTVDIPEEAQCFGEGTTSGTALAIVPGSKAGFPTIPILLVTSCVQPFFGPTESPQSQLFFLALPDPGSEDTTATLVRTLDTTVIPDFGWRSLAFRGDKGDLLACGDFGEGGNRLYKIDFSPFTTTIVDGTAEELRDAPAGATCDGITWDPSDQTIYQTTFGTDVLHFPPTGTTLTPVPHGCGGGNQVTGVQVAGTSLFVACQQGESSTPPSIRQLNKADGALVPGRSLPSPTAFSGDLEYDPVSFAANSKDAVWTIDQSSNRVFAVEVPIGILAQRTGTAVASPAACPALPAGVYLNLDGSPKDTDGDGLPDCWEDGILWTDGLPGISFTGNFGNPANRDVTLCVDANGNGTATNPFGAPGSAERATECASPLVKDIFVEIDYMQNHRPDAAAVQNVVAAFLTAPPTNPGVPATGIRLHVLISDQLVHRDRIALVPCTGPAGPNDANFDDLKRDFFGTTAERTNANAGGHALNAKRLAYRYGIFAHNQVPIPPSTATNTASGCAEVPGNDFLVTLASFPGATVAGHTGNVGTTVQQQGTLMHELGHNLGLRHGGGDNINCKPNYASVMNYNRQMGTPLSGLDFSRQQLITLNEANLAEAAGVGVFTGNIAFGPAGGGLSKPTVVSGAGAVNWNRDADSTDTLVQRDLNTLSSVGCAAESGTFPTTAQTLSGFDDWANIIFNPRATVDFSDGQHSTIDEAVQGGTLEITVEETVEISVDTDGDGVLDINDNCPNTFNTGQADSNRNGIGDACEIKIQVLATVLKPNRPGVLSVVIFGSKTRDVTKIDPASLVLHGAAANGVGVWSLNVKTKSGRALCRVKDVSSDKRQDLVCELEVEQGELPKNVSTVVLDAVTFTGETLRGFDSVLVRRANNVDIVSGTKTEGEKED